MQQYDAPDVDTLGEAELTPVVNSGGKYCSTNQNLGLKCTAKPKLPKKQNTGRTTNRPTKP